MRGPSGSGKSTTASKILEDYTNRLQMTSVICSTDSFFLDAEGIYAFDVKLLGVNHKKNQDKVKYYSDPNFPEDQKDLIIIDNTNLTSSEVETYAKIGLDNGYIIRLIVPDRLNEMDDDSLFAANTHSVPMDTIKKQREKFQTNQQVGEMLAKKLNCIFNLQTESLYREPK